MSKTRQKVRTVGLNKVQSLTLLKNLVRTSVSCVSFIRNLFPEECFSAKDMSGVTINTLKRGSGNKDAEEMMNWLEQGVFEALEKEYLNEIQFMIYTEENKGKNIIEEYTFKVDGEQSVAVNRNKKQVVSKSDIKGMTCQMLRMLVTLAQTLKPIPRERFLVMNLNYNDEAPDDYEPEYFRPMEEADEDMSFDRTKKRDKLRIGLVKTGKHEMTLKIQTTRDNFVGEGEETPAPEETPAEEPMEAEQPEEAPSTPEPQAEATKDYEANEDYELFRDHVLKTNTCSIKKLSEDFESDRDTIKAYLDLMVDDGQLTKKRGRYSFKNNKRKAQEPDTCESPSVRADEAASNDSSSKSGCFEFGGATPKKPANTESGSPAKKPRRRRRRHSGRVDVIGSPINPMPKA